ncbi:alpha/beta fold hydrolase [Brevibacterium album]|uniref:alpha/beta fold hydrolase n=1 Tax=Brevibacterium album TaxID=417948 RepID=UPI0003FFC21D|nr:alpha/beta hydrolase [Brevibacterium album]
MILAHDLTGDGPLLVLIHGITENRSSWDPIDLTTAFTVLRVDARGHGDSPAGDAYDPATLAADVHDTVEALRPGARPLVVGHSMGGLIATAYGARFPASGIVNVDQPLALRGLQEHVRTAEKALRGDGFREFILGLFAQMYGDLDPAQTARLDALRARIPQAVHEVWEPPTHYPHLQNPQKFAARIRGFAASTPVQTF